MALKRCSNLPFLPSEIIESEILPRLPVKSLLIFKLVCKSWNLLISNNNPDFIKSHLDLNPNNDSLILMCGDKKKKSYLNRDNDSLLQGYTEIIGSVNGFVSFYNWHDEHEGYEIAIWNPATKLTDIPDLPSRDVLECDEYFGFGFDSVANDYKIIWVFFIEEKPLVGEIYSCIHRCWRKITPSNFLFRGFVPLYNPMPVASFSSSPYWLSMQPNGEELRLTVISFDVRNEVFKMLPEVCSIDTSKKASLLMNFMDSIAVIVYDHRVSLTEAIDVYVFNERCGNWSRKSIGPLISKEPMYMLPLWKPSLSQCFRNDDILFLNSDRELCCVNLQTHAIKSLRKDKTSRTIVYTYNYSESLVFIEGMKHFNEKEGDVGIFFLRKA